MLHERIELLFHTLSCTNTEIADAAGCSRSNISHIRSGERNFKPTSKAIEHLAKGICLYAAEHDLLRPLCILTETEETSPEFLIPALIAWLFDADTALLPVNDLLSRTSDTSTRVIKRQEFGDKLNKVMNVLELSNARLARTLSVDDSLVSRWRSGLRSPQNNGHLSEFLAKTLLERARNMNCEAKLAKLVGIPIELLQEGRGTDFFASWLFRAETISVVPAVDHLLESISSLSEAPPSSIDPAQLSARPTLQERYWSTEGLRNAVFRFLTNALQDGKELWLYSDEGLTWMTGDPTFYATWKMLMAACGKAGVKIKIIHNINRRMDEMLTAISGWMPLYMSGLIEPYVFRKQQYSPFSHTFFLNPGVECIYGTGIKGHGHSWYDYITDSERICVLSEEFEALLSGCEPLLKVYTGKEYTKLIRNLENIQKGSLPTAPDLPFPDIRINMAEDNVTVIHAAAPCTAFSFTAPDMLLAFREYLSHRR